ncbi:sensor histidine kinase [Helicobacter sp. 23-1044]
METLDEVLKQIISEYSTSSERDSALRILEAIIEQINIAEREYSEQIAIYNLILEAIPTPIWVLNADGTFFYHNSHARALHSILEICPSDFSECEVLFENENYLMHKTTKNAKTIITATNITNEKQKERLASMGQISAHLAHEIRNPVGAINLMISSLLNENFDAKSKLCLLQMKRAIWQVERLIRATLMISKGVKSTKCVHSSDIIRQSVEGAIKYIDYGKKIDFFYDIRAESIVCDGELLNVLVQNLISNAIDVIEDSEIAESGIIKVEFFAQGAQILRIYDNGDEASDLANLFIPFKSTKSKGNGLGLALCKEIANAHNGEISYHKTPKYFEVKFEL